MKSWFCFLFFFFCIQFGTAQTTHKIQELEQQHAELKKQISESETLLQSTKKDVKGQLDNLALLLGQIEKRKKYLATISKDVQIVQMEIARVQKELSSLNSDLKMKKERYAKSLRYMSRHRTIQEKLMFIFSAENLNQMYRRMRYVRQYADFQHRQGIELKRRQKQVEEKQQQLIASKEAKENILHQEELEKAKLESQEKERKKLLATLQKKQRSIQNAINEKRRTAEQLDKQIDRLIAMEIEMSHKKNNVVSGKSSEKSVEEKDRQVKDVKMSMERYKIDSSGHKLSGVFEQNKGRLPIPITGPYAIIGHYGKYQVSGLKNVRLDNKGIDIKGKDGAQARAIFDGEVSAVFQYNGLSNVLVRHGSYISVYCNLQSIVVKKGDRLKTGEHIGEVHTDKDGNTVLHFQLRKEASKLNPELWLRNN